MHSEIETDTTVFSVCASRAILPMMSALGPWHHGGLIMVQFGSTLVLAAYGVFLRSMALWWREDGAWLPHYSGAEEGEAMPAMGRKWCGDDEDAGGYAKKDLCVIAAVHVCWWQCWHGEKP